VKAAMRLNSSGMSVYSSDLFIPAFQMQAVKRQRQNRDKRKREVTEITILILVDSKVKGKGAPVLIYLSTTP
jgi:hypothetical protein